MGVTQLVTPQISGGKRLILPADRQRSDHDKELTLAGERRTYPNGRSVVFMRLWCKKPWVFSVIAIDEETGIPIADAQHETWDAALKAVEARIRRLGMI